MSIRSQSSSRLKSLACWLKGSESGDIVFRLAIKSPQGCGLMTIFAAC
jgi:hypothetical protein